jgi:hypothetical protein
MVERLTDEQLEQGAVCAELPPTAKDGGSAANAGRDLRPTAKDGGSAANAGRDLRPTAANLKPQEVAAR